MRPAIGKQPGIRVRRHIRRDVIMAGTKQMAKFVCRSPFVQAISPSCDKCHVIARATKFVISSSQIKPVQIRINKFTAFSSWRCPIVLRSESANGPFRLRVSVDRLRKCNDHVSGLSLPCGWIRTVDSLVGNPEFDSSPLFARCATQWREVNQGLRRPFPVINNFGSSPDRVGRLS